MGQWIVTLTRSKTETAEYLVDADSIEEAENTAYRLGEKDKGSWKVGDWEYDIGETEICKVAQEPPA